MFKSYSLDLDQIKKQTFIFVINTEFKSSIWFKIKSLNGPALPCYTLNILLEISLFPHHSRAEVLVRGGWDA